jgi:broad specificity phosphatase PhoE
MGTRTVHFIRHGDTAASADGMFSGDLDPPLAPAGLIQAHMLAARLADLSIDAIYASPKVPDPASMSPPGGETATAIAARAMPVVDGIVKALKDHDALVFSHKATIRIIACSLLGIPLARFRDRVACPTASVTSFSFGPKGPMLVRLGDEI